MNGSILFRVPSPGPCAYKLKASLKSNKRNRVSNAFAVIVTNNRQPSVSKHYICKHTVQKHKLYDFSLLTTVSCEISSRNSLLGHLTFFFSFFYSINNIIGEILPSNPNPFIPLTPSILFSPPWRTFQCWSHLRFTTKLLVIFILWKIFDFF